MASPKRDVDESPNRYLQPQPLDQDVDAAPLGTLERLQDLLWAHGAGKIVLNVPQLDFVDGVCTGRIALSGSKIDQALQVLHTFRPQLHAQEEPAIPTDRIAWSKERFTWLWDQYQAKFGEDAGWIYFSAGFEQFKESAGYE
jgi:hypothetical protein